VARVLQRETNPTGAEVSRSPDRRSGTGPFGADAGNVGSPQRRPLGGEIMRKTITTVFLAGALALPELGRVSNVGRR